MTPAQIDEQLTRIGTLPLPDGWTEEMRPPWQTIEHAREFLRSARAHAGPAWREPYAVEPDVGGEGSILLAWSGGIDAWIEMDPVLDRLLLPRGWALPDEVPLTAEALASALRRIGP